MARTAVTSRSVLVLCGALVYLPLLGFAAHEPAADSVRWRQALVLVLLVLPAALARRRPVPALALMLVGLVVVAGDGPQNRAEWGEVVAYPQFLVQDVVVASFAASRARRTSLAVAAGVLAVQGGAAVLFMDGLILREALAVLVLAMVAAWAVGNTIRERREHGAELREQAATKALTEERLRIARELHDMVAHSLGIVALQAGAARLVLDTQPERVREALGAVEAASRETLSGLRRMLGALRQAEVERGAESSALDPAPGLGDVERLAAATTAAGVKVRVTWRGERRPLPPEIDLSAYRIIQESVTNVVRHAGSRSCQVSIECGEDELAIEVVDEGRGQGLSPDTGYGLIGMRERVDLLKGRFEAGPRREGGFRVAARLPLPAGVR